MRKFHKYRAKAMTVDGIKFPSKKQAARYQGLKILEKAGRISKLELEPSYEIRVNSV